MLAFDSPIQAQLACGMSLAGKKLCLLLSVPPEHPSFAHGLNLAKAALAEGVQVYLYCIDEAVAGVADPLLQKLKVDGLRLFACAYGAQRRDLPLSEHAVFGGLAVLADLIAGTDRFVSFN
jgi:sulfur relay (sulfurtransferase) complex TusBCD TusD component (DsrE family)